MGKVIHFELFTDDVAGLADFCREVFGWRVENWQGPGDYFLTDGGEGVGVNGAISTFGSAGNQPTVVTVSVDDLESAVAKIIAKGGKRVSEAQEVPGVGMFSYVSIPGGTVLGLMQETPAAAAEPADAWAQVGERLREFGTTVGQAVTEAAGSPQAQRLREHAERTAESIGEATKTAADKARPHVITALDAVSRELGSLAERMRGEQNAGEDTAPGAEADPSDPDA
jgi:uncharacterized protein